MNFTINYKHSTPPVTTIEHTVDIVLDEKNVISLIVDEQSGGTRSGYRLCAFHNPQLAVGVAQALKVQPDELLAMCEDVITNEGGE